MINLAGMRPRVKGANWFGSPAAARKRLRAGLVAALTVPLIACGGGASSSSSGPIKIGVVFYAKSIPYFQDVLGGIQDKAKQLGNVQVDVTYANFSVTDEVQLMENAIMRHPNGIILAPMDREALVPSVRKAKEAGIPVVTVGDNLGEDGRALELAYVGQSHREIGQAKAQYLVDHLKGKGQVLVVHGPRGLDYVEAQKEGYQDVFAKSPGIQVVEGPNGNFSSEVGIQQTENLLTTHPHPDGIFFDGDDLAIGGIQALKERNIDPRTLVTVSSDGTQAAIDAVKRGELTMTISVRPHATGMTALQTLYDYLVKKIVPHNPTPVSMLQITAQNVGNLKQLDYA